jgi:putative intracellular protease/amidase
VNPQDLSAVHALIVCGGKVDEFLVGGQHAAVAGLLTQARQQRQWLVSICTGAQVLLEHGLLANHFAARSPYREKFYGDRPTQQRPERWVNDRVVTSQRLLTAAGPEDAAELARTLVRTLQAAKP